MKFSAVVLFLGCMILALAGCGGSSYKLIESGPGKPKAPARVVVTDFKDERPFERKLASATAPFTFSKSYMLSRPEETFSGQEAFPAKLAKSLAASLEKGGHFESVQYASPAEMPARGSYDVLVTGTLKDTTASGKAYYYCMVLPLGFKFSHVLWYLGAPKISRHYDLVADVQVLDGYTEEPIGDLIKTENETGSKLFTVYVDEGKMNDLSKKVVANWNQVIEELHTDLPMGDESYWANQRAKGEKYLASRAHEEELIRRGSPPVFTFISPTDGSTLREPVATVRWSLTSPNGLKSVALAINNSPVETGVRALDLADADKAPRGVSARETRADLKMGTNVVEARVTDHRGNSADAQIELIRLPQPLTPARRSGLVIGMGSSAAADTANELAGVLANPALGQFDKSDVAIVTSQTADPQQIQDAIREFGPRAKSGELAFIYIAAPGNAEGIGSAGSNLPLSQLTDIVRRSLATEEVILLLDLNWQSKSDKKVIEMLGSVPSRWAVAVSSNTTTGAQDRSGRLLFGQSVADIISGRNVQTDRITLERMLDLLAERAGQGDAKPESAGRYNPNITMAEFK